MADASHELRTPVSIVPPTAQVARCAREGESSDDYRESLDDRRRTDARVTRLVDGIFLLARGEARGIPMACGRRCYLDDLSEGARPAGSLPTPSAA